MIFHALAIEGDARRPTLFLVDYDTPGLTWSGTRTTPTPSPTATHNSASRASACRPPGARRRRPGRRADERVVRRGAHPHRRAMLRRHGAAADAGRGVGHRRVQFGQRIYDFQGVSFPLADSAADASAARLPDSRGRLARRHRRRRQGRRTPRPRWPSSSRRRPRGGAPTGSSRSSAGVATCAAFAPERFLRELRGGPHLGRARRRSSA